MTDKNRKDNQGNILRKGESQRKNNSYQFRYYDMHNKRQAVYAPTLKELRQKEAEIDRQMQYGVDYTAGQISIDKLVQRYLGLKQGVRKQTMAWYDAILKARRQDRFFRRQINSIKTSDVKQWFIQLHKEGLSYSTLNGLKSILNPAFQMAYEEDAIRKNPCNFKLADTISNDKKTKFALSDEQQRQWLDFIKNDSVYAGYYDMYVVLLGTGLRVAEFCGLTRQDLDFKERKIKIDHQLLHIAGQGYSISEPKTASGVRYIPMTDEVYNSLRNALSSRSNVAKEAFINGYSGFVFVNQNGNPYDKDYIGKLTRRILNKYNGIHAEKLPAITPHILRHTFCSNMANAGMDVKTLQYIMGHSKVSVTLEVYTHLSYERAATEMAKVVDFQSAAKAKLAQ